MSKRALLLAAFFVVLFILHQDSWWKNDPRLVLGFLPVSLAYHVGWTLAVALAWWLVTKFAWPGALDAAPPPADPPKDPKSAVR